MRIFLVLVWCPNTLLLQVGIFNNINTLMKQGPFRGLDYPISCNAGDVVDNTPGNDS